MLIPTLPPGVFELVTFAPSPRVMRDIQRMRRSVGGLIVQQSEEIQRLFAD